MSHRKTEIIFENLKKERKIEVNRKEREYKSRRKEKEKTKGVKIKDPIKEKTQKKVRCGLIAHAPTHQRSLGGQWSLPANELIML